MAQLAQISEIRDRLNLASDPAQDATIDGFRAAIEERVLALTGFTFTAGTQVEQQVDVQLGISRLMKFRPIVPFNGGANPLANVLLSARSLASGTFSSIIGDIKDAYNGRIIPLSSELTPIFPPTGGQAPWFRWRQMIWPVVQFTYSVDGLGSPTNPVPASLNRAVIEWTASIIAHPGAGRLKSFTAEKISETYNLQTIPPLVMALIAPYVRGQGTLIY